LIKTSSEKEAIKRNGMQSRRLARCTRPPGQAGVAGVPGGGARAVTVRGMGASHLASSADAMVYELFGLTE
jgi:hypothetical protein